MVVDNGSILELLHGTHVGSVANISDVHAGSICRVTVVRTSPTDPNTDWAPPVTLPHGPVGSNPI
jgi:hypothetical protein